MKSNNKTKKKKILLLDNQESNCLNEPNLIKSKKIYRNKYKKYFINLLKSRTFLFLLFILFILSILLFILINKFKVDNNKLKICLCTLGKQENRYINEFVQHYKKYGVDKIYLYDNNDEDGEKFEEVISSDIEKGFVEIINWRGKTSPLLDIMNDCYKNNMENYDWLLFYEIDEYIHLHNYNIKSFLNQKKFEGCQLVYLNMICHTDNNKLYYQNESLAKRFPKIVPKTKYLGKNLEVKSIIRGKITNMVIKNKNTINNQ